MTDEPNYDSKTMQAKMADDPIASPTKDQITGNTVMQKIRSLIDNYLGWSKEITDKVNNLEPGGGGGKTYTAGDGIGISDDDVISNTDHTQTQTNTSDIASIRVSMSDMASSTALGAETEARKSADSTLQVNIDKKQDKLSTAQQSALDSGITATKVAKYDAYDTVKQNALNTTQMDAVNSGITAIKVSTYDKNSTDIAQLKISDSEHTDAISDISTQIDAQATEITAIKTKNASQDSDISALKTKTTNQDTEIQGLSESVVSDLTGTFTDSTRTLKLSLERESAPSIDCSVVIPGGTGGGDVTSVNGKTGAVTIGASDVLSTAQLNAVNSGITSAKVTTYDGYKASIDAKADTSTVSQIQTAVGGCFNDASISGNNLVLGTVGGQQNTLTLPGGGGGGATLPENGYYWEKITMENWPTDWTSFDILLICVPGTLIVSGPDGGLTWDDTSISVRWNTYSGINIMPCIIYNKNITANIANPYLSVPVNIVCNIDTTTWGDGYPDYIGTISIRVFTKSTTKLYSVKMSMFDFYEYSGRIYRLRKFSS